MENANESLANMWRLVLDNDHMAISYMQTTKTNKCIYERIRNSNEESSMLIYGQHFTLAYVNSIEIIESKHLKVRSLLCIKTNIRKLRRWKIG